MFVRFFRLASTLIVFLFLTFIFVTYKIHQNEKEVLKNDIKHIISNKATELREYFLSSISLIHSLKYTIEDRLRISDYTSITHPAFATLKYKKDKNLFVIINQYGKKQNSYSNLVGIGDNKLFTYPKKNEIHAALALKPIFDSSIQIIPDIKWVYYTSKQNFLYVHPNFRYKDDTWLKEQYKLAFWQEAIPKNNPNKSLILTDIYEDGAGKGLMTTLSLPVYKKEIFKGVVSIDIGLDILKNLLFNSQIGTTYLIDEKENIVESTKEFKLGEKIDSKDIVKITIVEDELYLVHVIDEKQINKEAFYSSLGKITILFLFLSMIFTVWYLNFLLKKVKYFADTDSLTKLLNRHAMQREVDILINTSKRYKNPLSFLLLDIDYFKKVNDTFGHDVGDKVLFELSRIFKNNTRNCDIVARFGGEEFLIALSNTNLDEAYILAERIRHFTQKIKVDNHQMNLTISIGCAKLHENDDFFTLLKRVDMLLYKAKDSGRNKTVKEEEN